MDGSLRWRGERRSNDHTMVGCHGGNWLPLSSKRLIRLKRLDLPVWRGMRTKLGNELDSTQDLRNCQNF